MKVKKEITDDEVFNEEIMKFRLGGVKKSVILLEFGRMLGIYFDEELSSENFIRLSLIARGE